jgi:CheY-like chemotaxis protein
MGWSAHVKEVHGIPTWLLVDHHPVVREVIARVLKGSGAQVRLPEALEALGQKRPDVVLSEIEVR